MLKSIWVNGTSWTMLLACWCTIVQAFGAELSNTETRALFDLSSARFAGQVCSGVQINPSILAALAGSVNSIDSPDLVEAESKRFQSDLEADFKAAPGPFCKVMQRLYGPEGTAIKNLLTRP